MSGLSRRDLLAGMAVGIPVRAAFRGDTARQLERLDCTQADPGDEAFWLQFRDCFDLDPTAVSFNHAGLSPSPRTVQDALAKLPAAFREQVMEGIRMNMEMANHPAFMAMDHGRVAMHIRDSYAGYGSADDCEKVTFTESGWWTADLEAEFSDPATRSRMFQVEFDKEKKTATLNLHMVMKAKVHWVRTERSKHSSTETTDKDVEMDIFTDLYPQPPFNQDIVVPLKETPQRSTLIGSASETGVTDYYGTVPVPFKFGPENKFSGTAHVSFSISHRPKPAKQKK